MEAIMSVSDINISSWENKIDTALSNIHVVENDETQQLWNAIALNILKSNPTSSSRNLNSSSLLPKGEQQTLLSHQVSEIASTIWSPDNHSLVNKIKALETLQRSMGSENAQDEEVQEYCKALMNECITLLKKEHKLEIENKKFLMGTNELETHGSQKPEDFDKLRKQLKGVYGVISEAKFDRLKNRITNLNHHLNPSEHQALIKAINHNNSMKPSQHKELKDLIEGLSLKPMKQLSDDQYQTLTQNLEELDSFFTNFEQFSQVPKKVRLEENEYHNQFLNVWTLWTLNFPSISRQKRLEQIREERITSINAIALPKGLTENLNTVKASLNFILAMTMLAKELNAASPDKEAIANAHELIRESAPYSEPAKLASQFNFNEWKNLNMDKKQIEQVHKDLLNEIKKSGCENFVSKKDLNDVFKILKDPKARSKEKIFKYLKTIAAVLTLPIAWTTLMITAIATLPLWIPLSVIIENSYRAYTQRDL